MNKYNFFVLIVKNIIYLINITNMKEIFLYSKFNSFVLYKKIKRMNNNQGNAENKKIRDHAQLYFLKKIITFWIDRNIITINIQ